MRSIAVSLPAELITRLELEIDRVQYGKLSRSAAIEQFIIEGLDKIKDQAAG
jgi:metal-responsive CopG/Arc/MetJ family transcriptional regulator